MSIAGAMGIDFHYGILAGAVSLMGGLGTSAAFGPYFETTYGIPGATTVAITAATFDGSSPRTRWTFRRILNQTLQN